MAYQLATSYAGESLLSGFNWYDGPDPTHGFVAYQSRQNAAAKSLFSIDESTGVVRLGVDHTNTYALNEGRPSIRLESKAAYNEGLFIADFLHMPPSQCGVWPAFWSYGPNWPYGGEIDIIEGVNTANQNIISAHTADGCTLSPSLDSLFAGQQRNKDCSIGTQNIGCGFDPPANDTTSYGDSFNAVNGGVYAMLWDKQHIKVWHFARDEIPLDITNQKPDPRKWKLADAVFGGSSCSIGSFFKNMSLVINTSFCGDWGNAVWGKTDQCNLLAPTCPEYVANNPEAFANAYWDVQYINVYQPQPHPSNGTTAAPTPEPTTTTTMTSFSTTTVTVSRGSRNATTTSSIRPSATGVPLVPVNPAKVGEFANLGCFGSSTGFTTFAKAKDSADMTLDLCIEACKTDKFAGLFGSKCYCANELDAGTRATSSNEGGMCDHPCPGNGHQFCGGLVKDSGDDDDVRSGNETLSDGLRRRAVRRGIPNTTLLTVYGAVGAGSNDSAPLIPLPPPLAPGSNVTYTKVISTVTAHRTVYPLPSTTPVGEGKYPMDEHHERPSKTASPVVVTNTVTQIECECEENAKPTCSPAINHNNPEIPAGRPPYHAVSSMMMPNSTAPLTPPVVTAGAPVVRGGARLMAALGAAALALAVVI